MSPTRPRAGRVVLSILAVMILIVTVIGAGVTTLMGRLQGNITTVDVADQLGSAPSAPIVQADDGTGGYQPLTVVLMGSDTRAGKGNGGFGSVETFGAAQHSDTVIVLHIAADRKSALAVSIPRDTVITLPTCTKDGKKAGGYRGRFNLAIELGGPGCTLKAINQMSGLDVHNFMLVDFGGFKKIVDAVGGVDICLAAAVDDPLSGLKLDKGRHTVQGDEALAFVRVRHGISDGSDTARIRRQQAFLSSLIRKVTSSGTLLNPAALLGVLNGATESLTTDKQLADLTTLKDLALSMKDLKPSNVTFTTLPWTPNGDNATVSVNTPKAQPIWDAMRDDTSWPPKSATGSAEQPLLKTPPSAIHVDALNGTPDKGKAKKVAKQLAKQGYIIEQVGNADSTDYPVTNVQFDPAYDVSAKTLIWATEATQTHKKKGLGRTLTLTIGADWPGTVRPVIISDITQDHTANVNTGDENYCAA